MSSHRILIVDPSDPIRAAEAIDIYVRTDGEVVLDDCAQEESLDDFMQRGRVEDCDCGQIVCICTIVRPHHPDCAFRRALACPVAIPCEDHEREMCPVCDQCTCDNG